MTDVAHPQVHKHKRRETWYVSYALLFTGLVLIMLSVLGSEIWKWPVVISAFVRDVGLLLSAVMAGTALHEKLLRDEMVRFTGEELSARLDAKIPNATETAALTARHVHQLFRESPPEMTGLRLLAPTRRNYSGYYRWVNERTAQDLFFAGRSVLHRIDADIKSNTGNRSSNAEGVILRRLRDGSKVRILFLDPRTDILGRLADEEGQTLEALVGDVLTSLEICSRLHELLQHEETGSLKPSAALTVRIYDRVPYFAYHKQDSDAIVGFYFSTSIGSSSAAYELVDDDTKRTFGEHFERILSNARNNSLIEFDGARSERCYFNHELYSELHGVCVGLLEERRPLVMKLSESSDPLDKVALELLPVLKSRSRLTLRDAFAVARARQLTEEDALAALDRLAQPSYARLKRFYIDRSGAEPRLLEVDEFLREIVVQYDDKEKRAQWIKSVEVAWAVSRESALGEREPTYTTGA